MRPALRIRAAAIVAACAAAWFHPGAHAARPLSSEDAGTADPGSCQLEAWAERAQDDGATVIAPACGVAPGVELGLGLVLPRARDVVRTEAGLGVKFAPEQWQLQGAWGEWAFGLKLDAAFEQHARTAIWHHTTSNLLGIASLKVSPTVSAHFNLGVAYNSPERAAARAANLALAWSPTPAWMAFVELQSRSRQDVFGGNVATLGARWWIAPEVFGLDLSASRESGAAPTLWTVGLGWYGLKF